MKLSNNAGDKPLIKALRWLAEERSGIAPMKDLAMAVVGSLKGGPAVAIARSLITKGWAYYIDEHKSEMVRTIKLTMIGRINADYLIFKRENGAPDPAMLVARIRALELALAPFAALYPKIESNEQPFLHMQLDACGVSAIQARIAYLVLAEEHKGMIYPWTPGPTIRLSGT